MNVRRSLRFYRRSSEKVSDAVRFCSARVCSCINYMCIIYAVCTAQSMCLYLLLFITLDKIEIKFLIHIPSSGPIV